MPPLTASSPDRAQTGIDFIVGIGVFMLVVAFVLAFVPTMFAPFFGMGAGDALVADRGADHLTDDRLALDGGERGELNGSAVARFEQDCEGSDWLGSYLSVGSETVNVTIENSSERLVACGDPPAGSETISTRIVTVDDELYRLRVVVW